MNRNVSLSLMLPVILFGVGINCYAHEALPVIKTNELKKLGVTDKHYQSYNIEMIELTGGWFWKPYGEKGYKTTPDTKKNIPQGMNPDAYQYIPPVNLNNEKLITLAKALSPAYIRVSGTWANSTYFSPDGKITTPPHGFNNVLTGKQWASLVNFSNTVGSPIITSFATSDGTRGKDRLWTSSQAKEFLQFNRKIGGNIVAAEFMNEPSLAEMGGAFKNYSATDYANDFSVFYSFMRKNAPDIKILGPGSVGENVGGWSIYYGNSNFIKTPDIMKNIGANKFDGFSYHHYGAVSQRCYVKGHEDTQTYPEDALTNQWLKRTDDSFNFYKKLRDKYSPGKPIWVTETGESACGGNPWAGTFLDTFRYTDQLGRLARKGVSVVAHNTLAVSDYSLLDEKNYNPKPDYWAALLWSKLMGNVVLDTPSTSPDLHLYAQCLKNSPGGVTLLALNINNNAFSVKLDKPADIYQLSADGNINKSSVLLNGNKLQLTSDNRIPHLSPLKNEGRVIIPARSIVFMAVKKAHNPYCY
ncbi:hypothetical protein EOH33_21470 [Salmonella enterica]|nr:hypothetical protein [Salmonella enterica]EAU9329433.1 hypothetical protein [Salmonella enterica]EDV2766030.1 hypothetical protein [Salmonella enterica subsp. enterica serovar Soahanina]EED3638157.1 hypothetical protein [Salmonella enterica subsp. enterica serovar Sundsvall]EHO8626082.1 hypothetical protein [Salmonella enterica]